MSNFLKWSGGALLAIGLLMVSLSAYEMTGQKSKQKKALSEAKRALLQTEPSSVISDSIETGETIGLLEIPAIEETMAIVEGTGEDELEKGVGHYNNSALPGEKNQILLSGHRDTVFHQLGRLRKGDELTIRMAKGTYSYTIFNIYIVKSNDTTVIRDTFPNEILTLSTCYPFSFIGNAPERYIIEARRN